MTGGSKHDPDDGIGRVSGSVPSWTTLPQAFGLFCRGATFRTAAPVAIIVGTVLSLVNQLQVVVDGDATWATWVRIVVNYAVPYAVASVGFLSACRARPEP
jgi:hypothetical protein